MLIFLFVGIIQISLLPINVDASAEYSRYLALIFQKYGNGGYISFEGLEHLMYNLGLGNIEFDPKHTIEQHRSKDYQLLLQQLQQQQLPDDSSDQKLRHYFEQQTGSFLANDANDIQVNGATQHQQDSKINDNNKKNNDFFTADHNLIEKGVILEFKEMHDPRHRHPREHDGTFDGTTLSRNVCLSPKSLLSLVVNHEDLHKRKLYKTVSETKAPDGQHNPEEEYIDFINTVKLTPVAFMKLCPALLAQIDESVCVRSAPMRSTNEDPKDALFNAWLYASAAIFILSICGLLGIVLVPLMKTVAYQEVLKFLVAIAIGTLSGDALMHLLPHALIEEHEKPAANELSHSNADGHHEHDNTPVWICACAFATAMLMYIIEHLLPLLKGENGGHGHGHSHSHGHDHSSNVIKKPLEHPNNHHHHNHHQPQMAVDGKHLSSTVSIETLKPTGEAKEINVMLNESKEDIKSPNRPLTPVAFMVIIGDGLHNLTDGLAIGAAFASDPVTGLATAFAVLCHELPHELGDLALLLQTGVSIKRALFLNIVSSVLSFLGMAIGLLIAGLHTDMTRWIYAGTAGSFLYIAFADLIPAMAEGGSPTSTKKEKLKNLLIQISGMLLGGVIMIIIAVNEESLEELFQ